MQRQQHQSRRKLWCRGISGWEWMGESADLSCKLLVFVLHRRVGGSTWYNRSGQQIFLTSKSSSFCWYKSPISPAGHPTSRQGQQGDSDEEDRRPHDNIFTFMIGFVTVFLSIVFLFCSLCCHDCLLYNFFLFAAALFRDTLEGLFWVFLVVKLAFFIQ